MDTKLFFFLIGCYSIKIGHGKVSLSVDKSNYAVGMYLKSRF